MEHKRKEVTITIYEEFPRKADAHTTAGCGRTYAPSLGYDRKAMLLAYSRQLRQLHAQQDLTHPNLSKPDWKKWKAAFICTGSSMRRDALCPKFQLWIRLCFRRLLGRFRRIRRGQFVTYDDDSHSHHDHRRMRWKHIVRQISWLWSCGGRQA
ncbi:uncharacterized protein [Typha angustifolia]|uniref:uncharacterized protein n=1 Tax=Typha angustifolia TaxID=59011 RepID=UPI003C302C8B